MAARKVTEMVPWFALDAQRGLVSGKTEEEMKRELQAAEGTWLFVLDRELGQFVKMIQAWDGVPYQIGDPESKLARLPSETL